MDHFNPAAPDNASRRVAVIGSGYVGLTAAACLARLGHRVMCTDALDHRVARLRRGETPILERDLPALVHEGVSTGRLSFDTDNKEAVRAAEIVFLCVPTPQGEDGSADMSFVETVVAEIAPHLPTGAIVVTKSTVPVGSVREVERIIAREDVHVVSNPEFLREGSAVQDFMTPDRVIIGSDSDEAGERVASLYSRMGARVVLMSPESAELVKYASNAFLATKLSFINSIAALCEDVGADIRNVAHAMGLDPRIGPHYLQPGPGWGGSCFPKDSAALLRFAHSVGFHFSLLHAAVTANEEQRDRIVRRVVRLAGGTLEGRVVALWGLTFKANTNDLRESPALVIAQRLLDLGACVRAYDPTVRSLESGFELSAHPVQACERADVLVVATEWDEFRSVDLRHVAAVMNHRVLLDARNLLDEAAAVRAGFMYEAVGFSSSSPIAELLVGAA
jgi:UDPglucose 6-dehydrogenase